MNRVIRLAVATLSVLGLTVGALTAATPAGGDRTTNLICSAGVCFNDPEVALAEAKWSTFAQCLLGMRVVNGGGYGVITPGRTNCEL